MAHVLAMHTKNMIYVCMPPNNVNHDTLFSEFESHQGQVSDVEIREPRLGRLRRDRCGRGPVFPRPGRVLRVCRRAGVAPTQFCFIFLFSQVSLKLTYFLLPDG